MITPNEGTLDRSLRGAGGVVLLLLGLSGFAGTGWSLVFDGIGLLLLVTAVVGFCPLYTFLGIDTRSHKA